MAVTTSKYTVIGSRPVRHDGVDKVTGAARYTADVSLPGTLWARALRSPFPYARIVSIDTSQAQALPGVHAVVTGQDLPENLIGRRQEIFDGVREHGVEKVHCEAPPALHHVKSHRRPGLGLVASRLPIWEIQNADLEIFRKSRPVPAPAVFALLFTFLRADTIQRNDTGPLPTVHRSSKRPPAEGAVKLETVVSSECCVRYFNRLSPSIVFSPMDMTPSAMIKSSLRLSG
ncbi:MAG: hypothetical protein IIA67_06690 [Planctomycetes bacterium]|nr:hypothetical protein [Planctomycetota bacterium]